MECILLVEWRYAATLRFRDAPRKESRSFITHLGPRHHVNRVLLLSGDREAEVRYLAGEVGISEMLAGQSPEEKVAVVKAEAELAQDPVRRRRHQRRAGHAGCHRGRGLRPE